MESLVGQFLIAAPQLNEPNFARSVVLMIQSDANGAFGLVLNQRSELKLADLWTKIDDTPCPSKDYVSIGGPVNGPILVLHTDPSHSDSEVLAGVHIASERDNVRHIVLNLVEPFRVFSGYAGWGSGQLETEFELGGWISVAATKSLVFDNNVSELWQNVVHLAGRNFLEDTLGIDDFSGDVDLN
jgi:putative transcriptional regulator